VKVDSIQEWHLKISDDKFNRCYLHFHVQKSGADLLIVAFEGIIYLGSGSLESIYAIVAVHCILIQI